MWKKIDPPARKSDYTGKFLRLNAPVPDWNRSGYPVFRPKAGEVCRISRRMSTKDTAHTACDLSCLGSIRLLKLEFQCPHCQTFHWAFIPESWISDGSAEFVEVENG